MVSLPWPDQECQSNYRFAFNESSLTRRLFCCFCRFPLFSKGVDTYRFEYGVFLLNKDIEMVRTSFCVSCNQPSGRALRSSWLIVTCEPWICGTPSLT